MPTAAAIVAGGGLLSAGIGAGAQYLQGNRAISAQQNMLTQGIGAAQSLYGTGANYAQQYLNQARKTGFNYLQGAEQVLNPLISTGQTALAGFMKALPNLTKPFDASTLPSTPGYEFSLSQGLKGAAAGSAATGQAVSGNEMKASTTFAQGLAQNTYQQQFQNYLAQNAQIANLLYQPVATGAGAAGELSGIEGALGGTVAGVSGNLGTALASGGVNLGQGILGATTGTGQGIASSLTGQGNAIAGAATGASNALTSGVQYAALAPYAQQLLQKQLGPGIPSGYQPLVSGGANPYTTNALATSGAVTTDATPYVGAPGAYPFMYAGG